MNCIHRDVSCDNASSKKDLELNVIVNHSIFFTNDGTATRYGLNGPGIESRWGRDFPHPFITALGPTMDAGSPSQG
jgi:hypothetical protein